MKQVVLNELEKVVVEDHNDLQLAMNQSLFDDTLRPLFGFQDGAVNSSFTARFVSALAATLDLGVGFKYDPSQTGYNPKYRMIQAVANIPVTFTAANGSNPRIDLVCLTPTFTVTGTALRWVKNVPSGTITQQTIDKTMQSGYTLTVVAGTPAATPVAPATPAGSIPIARCLIRTGAGMADQNDIVDVRTVLYYTTPSTAQAVTKTGMVNTKTASLHTNLTIDGLDSNANIALGAAVTGSGAGVGGVVTGYVGTTGVTVSVATTTTASSQITFTNPTHNKAIGNVLQAQLDQLDAAIPPVPGFGTNINVVIDPSTQSPYNVDPVNDRGKIFEVLTANAAMTFNFPAPVANFKCTILDRDGMANTNAITLHRAGSEKVQNLAADYLMEAPYGRWDWTTEGTQYAF